MRKMLKELLGGVGTFLLAGCAIAAIGGFARGFVWALQFGWNAIGKILP